MSRPSKIPEKLHSTVLGWAGDGMVCRDIADKLESAHGIKVGHVAVSKLLKKLRAGREEVTRAVVAKKLEGHVVKDLDRLDKHLIQLDQVADALRKRLVSEQGEEQDMLFDTIGKTPAAQVYAAVVRELRGIAEKKLELSGAGGGAQGGTAVAPQIYTPAEDDDG